MSMLQWTTDVGRPLVGTAIVFFALCFFWVGYLLLRGSRNEYERNRARVTLRG
jgi:hypothetical protein